MSKRRVLRAMPVAAAAVPGVLLGHWLTYLAALPQNAVRATALATSGHGYWVEAIRVAVALGVCGFVAVILLHLRDASGSDAPRFSALLLRLGPMQCLAFVAMESFERLAAHAPLSTVLTVHVLVLGLACQVLTACIGAMVLRLLNRTVARIVAVFGRRPRRSPIGTIHRLAGGGLRPRLGLVGGRGLRGPPSR
jgi:hypothetical protein